jgi:hypothetical protein
MSEVSSVDGIFADHSYWLESHRGTAIGMQGELTGLDVLFLAALLDQSLGQLAAFAISDHPAGDVAGMPIPRSCRLSTGFR